MSFESRNTQGSMFPQSKWIFVGAKLSGPNRHQQIKGIIAHELCHYVMKLVYENNEEPYFKHDKERQGIFKEIMEALDKWSENDDNDECDEIISAVYRCYSKTNWIAELIVRVPQILAHFDNDPEKIKSLEVLYQRLFQYYERYVVPDMVTIDLEEREKIRKLNKNFGILPVISKLKYEFPTSKNMNSIYSNNCVAKTNVSRFLYSEIYKSIHEEYGNLADVQNIFLNYDNLNKDEISNDYSEIIEKCKGLNIFVDCTGEDDIELFKIGFSESNKFIFICTKEEQYKKLVEILTITKSSPPEITRYLPNLSSKDYDWHHLSQKSQKALLQTEINFQNSKQKFMDILWNKKSEPSSEDIARICETFSEIADTELLSLMAENKDISIQTNLIHEIIDDNFQIIFRDRNFIKKIKFRNSYEISQKDLILNTKKDQFMLISDIAGTGKSWAIKKITKMLHEQNPTKWITYIDLKQVIKDLKGQKKNELTFSNFLIEKVFDFKKAFESKMFKELYKKGQVCILFDGFDEISPNYAEVVKKLIESFQQNGGNQLWIATRDFFEVDLQKHLKLDVTYKLVDFRDDDGIDLIIRNCVLTDLRLNKVEVNADFESQVKNHPKYQIYLKAAIKLHQKVSNWTIKSIGLPQLYKMIGDVLIEFQDSTDELTEFTLYDKFIDHLFKRCFNEKGELREKKCSDSMKKGMNYRELHQFCAMKSLFPKNAYFCDLELDKESWSDVEIVGGGILNKSTKDGDEFLFPHETYREFFAASFIIRILKKMPRQIDTDVLKYLIKFCSNPKYGVIQMFLSHGFMDIKALPNNKMIIVSTNVPKLLQINIYQHIQEEYKNVEDVKDIFVIPDDLKSSKLCEEFGDDFIQHSNLNSIIKPQKCFKQELQKLIDKNSVTIIIIVSNEERCTELSEVLQQFKFKPSTMDINYNWNDLTDESQNLLLKDYINIHNHTNVSLRELLTGRNVNNDDSSDIEDSTDFSAIVDDEILNIIANKSQIEINKMLKYDMESKQFQLLFQPRSFIKKVHPYKDEKLLDDAADKKLFNTSNYTVLSQDQLLADVKNKHYVLISDVAGTGKSYAVQNIANTLRQVYPTKWITYINLSVSLTAFVNQSTTEEFSTYCIENLLKIDSYYNLKNCFINRYNSGNTIFIFDGYDEIAPDYAEFVADLAKLFEFKEGNQLWIITRDYFEVNLQQKLKINNTYKLNEFTDEDGIQFIVASWILMDLKDQTVTDFESCLNNSVNLTKYCEKAKILVQKVAISKNHSIGLPQLFSMIASGFKDDKYVLDELKSSKIFTKFVQTMHIRWLKNNQLREEANAVSLDYELNFKELHQYFAILSLFPDLINLLFPNYDVIEWPEVEIIACGFINKIGSSYSFNNKTFREYFVAYFIFKGIKKPRIKKEIVELLTKVLTIQKYGIIRMFLKDFIDNPSLLEKVQIELEKSNHVFNKMENLSEYFKENLEHLKKGDNEK